MDDQIQILPLPFLVDLERKAGSSKKSELQISSSFFLLRKLLSIPLGRQERKRMRMRRVSLDGESALMIAEHEEL